MEDGCVDDLCWTAIADVTAIAVAEKAYKYNIKADIFRSQNKTQNRKNHK
jgi:hypothetical protein